MSVRILPVAEEGLYTVPPVVHQIWVGPEMPEWVERSWERMDAFLDASEHDFEVHRWTEHTLKGTLLEQLPAVAAHYNLPPRGLADLIRIQAVGLYGGFYFDADIVPLTTIDDIVGRLDGWIISQPITQTENPRVLYNGAFALPKLSMFASAVTAYAARALERGVRDEHTVAGPQTYRRIWNELGEPVPVEWTLPMRATAAERRIQGIEGEFDMDAVRAARPGARVAHIGLPKDGSAR